MLINELRGKIKNYNKNDLETIIVELYKRIPKNKKEDYCIDDFIENPKTVKNGNKKELIFDDLKKQIIYFLQCVDNEYYAIPNRVISKKDRSAWRFVVKRFYKELNNIPVENTNGIEATNLLIEIFKRLSIGSSTLLFTNWETFRALGVSQADYYDLIIKRILYNGYSIENLEKCVNLLDVSKDPNELSYSMFFIFISSLKTTDNKEIAINVLNNKIVEVQEKLKKTKSDYIEFYIIENINYCIESITNIYLNLHEVSNAINYYHKNYIEKNKEVKEYILLNILENFGLNKEWIEEYEKNLNKIDYRKSLIEKYHKLKN